MTRESTTGEVIDEGNDDEEFDSKPYFDLNLTPKYINKLGLNANNYITIIVDEKKFNTNNTRFFP